MAIPRKRGPGRPRKLPVEEQRALVLAAARQVFATSGVQGATIEQIARQAGLSRQAVYELFGDKAALFEQTVADLEEQAYAAIAELGSGDADLDLKSWARKNYGNLFAFVAEHPEALPLLHEAERTGEPALTRLRARLAEVYREASGRRWAEFGVEPGRADTALVAMYFAMVEALVGLPWPDEPPERDALIDLLTEFTIGGVLRLYGQTPEVIDRVR
ncbi:AcrR family transcriptional regulator [Amycolatopsis bartoniae]|uniref:TetR family transcriptional regulator n=1 Tax=Amycolatopsis bartoniae TaxID=941986 RepID=A0A8H9ISX0_9PSEU|nr:TetR/AcrR family transcriptional regulator [Amycolatopsis bartoniae]MBB2933027.1 AcrR family transcriptional regulator [Amycolatopsis bartoniae]TVT03400.1 TetR/AcrR family transcriptional regulator [Amycolatopsis bartoniae]GHF56493.1 TetR family transcriptional regulator [Amycolatopsis bartoniae]